MSSSGNEETPSVSIVMTTFNGKKNLIEQLDSIRLQEKAGFEVIINDDCSVDNTVGIINDYIKKYRLDNIKLFVNKCNIGFRENFISAIENSSGDLIFLCDQDDIWRSDKIEKMTEAMIRFSEIDLLACGFTELVEDGGIKNRIHCKTVKYDESGSIRKVAEPDNLLEVPYPGCTYCVRRTFYDRCKKYWLQTCPHDAFLWRSAEVMNTAYVYDLELMIWRKHGESSWNIENTKDPGSTDLKWRNAEEAELKMLLKYAKNEASDNVGIKKKIANNLEWVRLRKKLIQQKDIRSGLRLIRYLNLYPRYRTYIRDWVIAFSAR